MPHETAHDLASVPPSVISTFFSLFGIGILIARTGKMTNAQLTFLILSGLCSALLVPAFVVPFILYKWPGAWWPAIPYLYAAAGWVSGLIGTKVVAAILAVSDRLPGAAGKVVEHTPVFTQTSRERDEGGPK